LFSPERPLYSYCYKDKDTGWSYCLYDPQAQKGMRLITITTFFTDFSPSLLP